MASQSKADDLRARVVAGKAQFFEQGGQFLGRKTRADRAAFDAIRDAVNIFPVHLVDQLSPGYVFVSVLAGCIVPTKESVSAGWQGNGSGIPRGGGVAHIVIAILILLDGGAGHGAVVGFCRQRPQVAGTAACAVWVFRFGFFVFIVPGHIMVQFKS